MNCELMKAEEARAITNSIKQAAIMNIINEIANKIKIAAGAGESYIDWHWHGSPNVEVYYFLESQGYKLKDYDDYNETYTEISWR